MPGLESLGIAGAYRLRPRPARDARGWFVRYLDTEALAEVAPAPGFVHFNHSRTEHRGSVRGLHLQIGAAAEVKLVKCVRGAVLDVLVDCRRGSPTFLQHALLELVEGLGDAVLIPRGVAHGFQTLQDQTELIYHHSHPYQPDAERGLRYDDPMIGISWPMPVAEVSGKDEAWPFLKDSFEGYEIDP